VYGNSKDKKSNSIKKTKMIKQRKDYKQCFLGKHMKEKRGLDFGRIFLDQLNLNRSFSHNICSNHKIVTKLIDRDFSVVNFQRSYSPNFAKVKK
jgi:hypothetical protein